LISDCLNVDEEKRISLEQIKNHEWLTNLHLMDDLNDECLTYSINKSVLINDSIDSKESLRVSNQNILTSITPNDVSLFWLVLIDKPKVISITLAVNNVKYARINSFEKIKQKLISLFSYVKRITNSFIFTIISKILC
jgi:serine/threonine protein kinase